MDLFDKGMLEFLGELKEELDSTDIFSIIEDEDDLIENEGYEEAEDSYNETRAIIDGLDEVIEEYPVLYENVIFAPLQQAIFNSSGEIMPNLQEIQAIMDEYHPAAQMHLLSLAIAKVVNSSPYDVVNIAGKIMDLLEGGLV